MDWAILQNRISGKVVTRSSIDFSAVRESMVWNALKPDRSPQVIVKVKNENDVVQAINFARENGLKVVVHGGGHTWCGLALRNGGMTIDLSELNALKIDPSTKTAIIQPVISNQELAHQLGCYDLAFPIGHCPTVKSSGYLLNGGMSWNMSDWGPACLSIEAIEFVTASGQMIQASAKEHSDLFWAARGCGPGMFAVATRFHLKCFPLPKGMMTSTYYYALSDLHEVVEEATAIGWKMPSCVELSIFLMKAPLELADKCKENGGKICMINAVAFAQTPEEATAALALLEQGTALKKCLFKATFEKTSFKQLGENAGASWPENHRNLCENQSSKANPVDILMALRDKIIDAPSPKSLMVFCQSTGQHNLIEPHPDISLSMDATSYGGVWSIWENQEEDAANEKWHNACTDILKQFKSTPYIGETDIVQDPSRVQKAYTPEKWKRLEQIRAKYDPDGLFFGFLGGINP